MSRSGNDATAALVVLAPANRVWAAWREKLLAAAVGRRLCLEHLGYRATSAVWRGDPFLTRFRGPGG